MTERVSRSVGVTLDRSDTASRLAYALKTIGEQCAETIEGQFGRVALVEMDTIKLDSREIDFEFTCAGDDDLEANECEIIIYNLSSDTAKQFRSDKRISVTAGYRDDTGVIFSGVIVKVSTVLNGVDRVTTIRALDDVSRKEKKVESITYAAGTKASYILRELLGRVGLPVKEFQIVRDHTYKDKTTVDGDIIPRIVEYANVCGISVYINKGQIYARSLKSGDDIRFEVSADTGLIGAPEEFEEERTAEDYTDVVHGYKLKMLLQHRMTTAAVIDLSSRNVSGRYRVKSWKHVGNESDFITELEVVDA